MNNRNDYRRYRRLPQPEAEQRSTRPRATELEIQKWIARQHGFVPESAWIAHCKELFGIVATSKSATESSCPPEKIVARGSGSAPEPIHAGGFGSGLTNPSSSTVVPGS